jgi:D-amino-acid dehydrogenase
MFPLAERRDAKPWLGRRPCLPDMIPIIGHAPRLKGLWLDFGHQHWGLTLGPVSGRLLAQMMTGEPTLVDPAPFRAERFG